MTANEIVNALRHCTDESKELCPPCPYFSWDKQKDNSGCMGEMMESAADLIEQQQAEIERLKAEVPKWISVEERLPEDGEWVICVCRDGEQNGLPNVAVLMASYDASEGWWMDESPDTKITVTHWMLLPQPPEVSA